MIKRAISLLFAFSTAYANPYELFTIPGLAPFLELYGNYLVAFFLVYGASALGLTQVFSDDKQKPIVQVISSTLGAAAAFAIFSTGFNLIGYLATQFIKLILLF